MVPIEEYDAENERSWGQHPRLPENAGTVLFWTVVGAFVVTLAAVLHQAVAGTGALAQGSVKVLAVTAVPLSLLLGYLFGRRSG